MIALASGALLSLCLAVLTIAIHFRRYGGKMIRSNRDAFPPLDGLAGRVVRAHASLNEALVPFAILVLVAQALHISNTLTVIGAGGFLAAHLAHALFYLMGATPWRSLSYYAGLAATLVVAVQLPWSAAG
jgi:uncharacterized MAPEG superfamily protein